MIAATQYYEVQPDESQLTVLELHAILQSLIVNNLGSLKLGFSTPDMPLMSFPVNSVEIREKVNLRLGTSAEEVSLQSLFTPVDYTYRNLPWAGATHAVHGLDSYLGGGGILEYCLSAEDALDRYKRMVGFKRFSALTIKPVE